MSFTRTAYKNHVVYCSSTAVTGSEVEELVNSIKERKILIITGTHGNTSGQTGADTPTLLDYDFFHEDKVLADQEIHLLPADNLLPGEIKKIAVSGSEGDTAYAVIVLAYCYSCSSLN